MKKVLILSSMLLCLQSQGYTAIRHLSEEFGHIAKRSFSTISLQRSVQTLPNIVFDTVIQKPPFFSQQFRMFSSIPSFVSLADEIHAFLNNGNTEIRSISSSFALINDDICQTINGLQEIKEVGYVRDLDSLLGTWSWKLNELKKDKADVEKLTRAPFKFEVQHG
jgi:hypothetical protein